MTTEERVIQPDDSQPPSRERFGAQGSDDEVARLVRLAGTSGPIAAEPARACAHSGPRRVAR